ncbi:MAG: WG repeat-containing protein, partial [Muribaculaceae bacterium]|nr:WG repeat-containing protein [Muribaculaceae bacterium]
MADVLPEIYSESVFDNSRIEHKKYGFIDANGNRITDPIYDKVSPFSPNGLALVSYNNHYGYITTTGQYFIEVGLKNARPFDQFGLAAIKINKKWGLIDNRPNVWVINDIFDEIDIFQPNGLAIVKYEKKYGLIDTLGNVVLPVIYDKIEKFDKNGYAYIKNDNKIGVVDKRGRAIISPEYKDKKSAMAAVTELKAKLAKPSEISLADMAAQARKGDEQRSEQSRKEDVTNLR